MAERPASFEVNARTNWVWKRRVELVEKLITWVCEHLDPMLTRKKWKPEDKRKKAGQYVYEYFIMGKMFYPLEGADPLFTKGWYVDRQVQEQLVKKNGMYQLFREEVMKAIRDVEGHVASSGARRLTRKDVTYDLGPSAIAKVNELFGRLEREHSGQDSMWKEDQIVGLVLRYKCLGGFGDNMHGSVPASWAEMLGSRWVECFASPFNHKFDEYFSYFDADKVFGSRGNFFHHVVMQEGGILGPGLYQFNPPWNNQVYGSLYEILKRSLLIGGGQYEVIMVGPAWDQTTWIPLISSLFSEDETGYRDVASGGHSFVNCGEMGYVHDTTAVNFTQNAVYWVFSKSGFDSETLRKLQIPKPED